MLYRYQNRKCAICEKAFYREELSFFGNEDFNNLFLNPRLGKYRQINDNAYYLKLNHKFLLCHACYRARSINLKESDLLELITPRDRSIFCSYFVKSDGSIGVFPKLFNNDPNPEKDMIKIYNLNRDALVSNRKLVYSETIRDLNSSNITEIESNLHHILNLKADFLLVRICALSRLLQNSGTIVRSRFL